MMPARTYEVHDAQGEGEPTMRQPSSTGDAAGAGPNAATLRDAAPRRRDSASQGDTPGTPDGPPEAREAPWGRAPAREADKT